VNSAAILRRQFIDVLDKIPDNAWLLTHRPLNAMFAGPVGAQSNDRSISGEYRGSPQSIRSRVDDRSTIQG